jgi:transcriptional regulator
MSLRRKAPDRAALLQGTLDMLILRTLIFGPAHGHQIARHIRQTTDDLLTLEHGSLYPALHRLEREGWVDARWEVLGSQKRVCKYYRLTPAGRRQLAAETSHWKRLAAAIARVMTTAPAKG